MLSGVTVSCFLLSYLIVLAMEASRVFLKLPGRNLLLIGMLAAGLVAHSIFLVNQLASPMLAGDAPQLLSNWFQWSVLGAWGLAAACLLLTLRNPNSSMGLFLLPLVLALIGLAQALRGLPPFQPETTVSLWRTIHGVSLLIGTMFISFGLAFGLMYLMQSYRLKSRRLTPPRFKLPTLEFSQSMNRLSLFSTAIALGLGVLSGIVLNVDRQGQIAWFSGSIVFSAALFIWALVAAVLEVASGGSLGGRRSAYLAIANFVFLAVVLAMLLFSSHARPEPTRSSTSSPLQFLSQGFGEISAPSHRLVAAGEEPS